MSDAPRRNPVQDAGTEPPPAAEVVVEEEETRALDLRMRKRAIERLEEEEAEEAAAADAAAAAVAPSVVGSPKVDAPAAGTPAAGTPAAGTPAAEPAVDAARPKHNVKLMVFLALALGFGSVGLLVATGLLAWYLGYLG